MRAKLLKFFPFALLVFIKSLAFAQSQIDAQQLLHDVKALSADSMQGRKACSEGSKQAQAYISAAFEKNNLQSFNGNFRQVFSFSAKGNRCNNATNLIGYIPGASPDCIVLSAHYDHLGVVNETVYYGADDNASGVATLLAIMSHFDKNPPRHTLIFAVFDAEESGLQGSRAFVNNPPVEKNRLALNVNLDMVSRNGRNELYAAGTSHYRFLKPYLEKIAQTSSIKLLFGHDVGNSVDNWTNASDHAPFHQAGIPFIYFGVEDHQDYHQPTDVFANIDQKFFVNAAGTILDAVVAFDKNLAEIKAQAGKLNMPSGH